MGFFDSIKAVGRAFGSVLEGAVETFGPTFAEAGASFLFGKAFPGQTASLPFGTPPIRGDRPRAPFPGEQPFQIPRQLPPVIRGPGGFVSDIPRPPGPSQFPVPIPFAGGRQQMHFPTSQDVSGVSPTAGRFELDLPGPFTLRSPIGIAAGGIGCPSLFSAPGTSARPISMFMVPNPVTGKPTFFKHAGRPILFSGDLRACKVVNRIAARARRVRGR